MSDLLLMCEEATLQDTPSATFSLASGVGVSPLNVPDGPLTAPSGPAVVPVSPLVSPDAAAAAAMRGISGPISSASLASVSLQLCLESRLRANLDGRGSLLFRLTWKHWDMLSGQPICALRASGHRISGNGCGGWPTPSVSDDNCSRYEDPQRASAVFLNRENSGSRLAAWATPQAHDTRPAGAAARIRGGVSRMSAKPGVGVAQGDANHTGPQRHGRPEPVDDATGWQTSQRYGATTSVWGDLDWLPCLDNKTRPIKSGLSPLVNVLPRGVVPGGDPSDPQYANATPEGRVMRLRGYGNAIVPELAAVFIRSYMECQ